MVAVDMPDRAFVMTDATLITVPDDDQSTPRRTIRIPDDEWNAGLQAAETNQETLSAVIRRRVADYVLSGVNVEYRATSRSIPGLTVQNITGDPDEIRSHFPAKHWILEGREATAYRHMGRRPA